MWSSATNPLPSVADPIFEEIERNLGVHLVFKPDEALHHEQFDIMRI